MKKAEQLETLKNLGYNVPDYVVYRDGSIFSSCGNVSIRTEPKVQQTLTSHMGCPHFPNISLRRSKKVIASLRDKYHILIQEGIDPAQAECAGTCMYDGRNITLEIAWGSGTVRRVTSGTEVIDSNTYTHESQVLPELREVVRCAEELFSVKPVIVEWSMYKIPVGIKKQQLIFWGFSADI